MIWDATDWTLYHTFESTDLRGWYTITYLSLEREGRRLVCGTMNGHIIVWDILARSQLFAGRMHNGSIEGLEYLHYRPSTASLATLPLTVAPTKPFASCGADGNIMVYEFVNDIAID